MSGEDRRLSDTRGAKPEVARSPGASGQCQEVQSSGASSDPLEVIYDGHCIFCARTLGLISRIARRKVFRLNDANHREMIRSRFPGLEDADLDDAMFVVAPSGETYRGFFAFRRMMRESPWLYPFLLLFYFPGASVIGPRVYAWIARHRRSLGCGASCHLHATSREQELEE